MAHAPKDQTGALSGFLEPAADAPSGGPARAPEVGPREPPEPRADPSRAPSPRFRVVQGEGSGADAEAALVDSLIRGDSGAELAAWNRFSPAVDRTLRRLMGPGPDREDLVQEVFIRFFRRVRTLRERTAVRAFLTGICVHVVQWEIARRRRRRWLQLTARGDLPEPPSHEGDTELREAVQRYYRLLDRLKDRERSIFVARTIEGMTLEEVAQTHGVSVSTAQRRINRATKRIAMLVRKDPVLMVFVGGRDGAGGGDN